MDVAVCLFSSDLRLHDQPVLHAALRAAPQVVPLFVVDTGIADAGFMVPNRAAFLAGALADLDAGLRERGGRLVIRTGDVVAETCRVASETGSGEVHLAAGVSGYALGRERRLRAELAAAGRDLVVHDAVITALPPGAVLPSGPDKDHFAVFTPYFRRWQTAGLRSVLPAPRSVRVPAGVRSEDLPSARDLCPGASRPPRCRRVANGPGAAVSGPGSAPAWPTTRTGRTICRATPPRGCRRICTSAASHRWSWCTRHRPARTAGAEAFVRQLAWRDFHHQVLAARPGAARADYRDRGDRWRFDRAEVNAWQEGRTGYPVVDAGMRQLRHEGWLHNRARMLVASFLTKTLYVDWRVGARHFLDLLVDGDIANNQLNWQWMAGTGTDTRPNRVLNPLLQARRFDPRGDYVRRWVPELAGLAGAAVHQPWKLSGPERAAYDYPDPVVDLADALVRFRRARGQE